MHKYPKLILELISSFPWPCYFQQSLWNLKRNTQNAAVKTAVSSPAVTAMVWWKYIWRVRLCLHTIFQCLSFQVSQTGIQQTKSGIGNWVALGKKRSIPFDGRAILIKLQKAILANKIRALTLDWVWQLKKHLGFGKYIFNYQPNKYQMLE